MKEMSDALLLEDSETETLNYVLSEEEGQMMLEDVFQTSEYKIVLDSSDSILIEEQSATDNYRLLNISHPKIISSITSWKILSVDGRRMKKFITKPYAISVNNLGLYERLKSIRSDIIYLPNCVDTKLFRPSKKKNKKKKPHSPIILGWTGNTDREEKNYKRLLMPVIKRLKGKVSFRIIKTKKRFKGSKYKSKTDMNLYYNSLDYYLNVSSFEGTPNPCLEAASCGIPIISTPVGNMPDIIEDGINGFFLKEHLKSIVNKIHKISLYDKKEYNVLSENIRDVITKSWSIKSRSKAITEFFKS